ncbi:MAG: TonB-dependent receptor, partial [Flavobacteriales bacterium]
AQAEIDADAMERASGRTLTEMLERVPGVTSLASGPTISKPMIHGLYGNRVLTLNQGIRQEDQQWGNEHAPALDPYSADRISVVKGAASVQYGADAIGGVVITEPVALPRKAGLRGEVRSVGMLNGRGAGLNGVLSGGVKGAEGLGWRVQGSGRYLGDSFAPDYSLTNTGVRDAGASAALGWQDHRLSGQVQYSWFERELAILRASHIGNLTDLQNAINTGEPWIVEPFSYDIDAPRQTVAHQLVRAEAAYRVSDLDQLVATYGFQTNSRQEYDVRRGGRSSIPSLDLLLNTHSGDLVLKHFIGKHVHGRFGVSGLYQTNENLPGTGVRPLIPDYTKTMGSVFWLEHFASGERVEFEVGARYEGTVLDVRKFNADNVYITPQHDFRNYALSAGTHWTVRDSLHLRANVASAYRPPNVSELYSEGLHHGTATIELGDSTLGSERAYTASVDLEGSWLNGRLSGSVTAYVNRIDDYIYLVPDGYELTIRGAFPVFRYVATDAMLYGLDLSVEYSLSERWLVRDRSSIVRGRDRVQNNWLFLMPADRTANSLVYRKPVAGRWKDLEISVTSTVVLEQTRAPEGVDLIAPPGAYHLLGVGADIARPLKQGELRFGIQGGNLLNATYRDYLDRFRYFADARGLELNLWLRYSFGASN